MYGPIRVDAEEGYDVSVQFDLENLPDNPGLEWEEPAEHGGLNGIAPPLLV